MQDFNQAFSNFLESKKADKSFDWFYSEIRQAFYMGYIAGGGKEIESDKVIELYRSDF